MITESVKNILGEDLTSQVEAALKGKGKDGKDVDLVVGNDGTFVPAEKVQRGQQRQDQRGKRPESCRRSPESDRRVRRPGEDRG